MVKKMKVIVAILAIAILTGCATAADTASTNLSKAADQFQITPGSCSTTE